MYHITEVMTSTIALETGIFVPLLFFKAYGGGEL